MTALVLHRPGLWSFAAFCLSTAGVLAATTVIVSTDSDPASVRWWLVVAPLAISAIPLLVAKNAARLAAALLLTAWCVVAAASIGTLLWPALFAQYGAWIRERS